MTQNQLALAGVRMAAAVTMVIHGITRLSLGTVSDFDGWLASIGFPSYTSWGITFFEILGGLILIWGKKWVPALCIIFSIQLVMGIFLVHAREGWFVVGAGRNGMEYNVLLIICFVATAVAHWKRKA